MAVANGVFVQQGFSIRPDYQSAVLSVYKSNMKNLDFARDSGVATKYVNELVTSRYEPFCLNELNRKISFEKQQLGQ